jgi:hypothetical protein
MGKQLLNTDKTYSKDWYSSVYEGLIYASIVAFFIGFFTNGEASLGAYIAGYVVLSFGILMILLIIIKNILKSHNKENSLKKQDSNTTQSSLMLASTIIVNAGPFLFILFIVSVLLYLLTSYKNRIIEGNISPSYGTFSNLIAMLLLVLLYIIHTNITTEDFKNKGEFSLETSTVVYFLSILLWICTSIIYIVLYYYTTDGFSLMDLTKYLR